MASLAPPASHRQHLATEWLEAVEQHTRRLQTEQTKQTTEQVAAAAAITNANAVETAASSPAPADVVRGDECASDLTSFCRHEANVLTLLEDAPVGVDPASVARAVKNVRLCLAKNVEALSPACIEALVADVVSRRHATDAIQQQQQQQQSPLEPQLDGTGNAFAHTPMPDYEDSSVEVSIHYSKHHTTAGLRGHPALAAATPTGEPTASLSAPPGALTGVDGGLGSPLLWLLVFPFFCVGVYVSYNYALVYVRRRRELLRIESKLYQPLP